MALFPGSSFFIDSKLLENQVKIPTEYELPLFIEKRLGTNNRRTLEKVTAIYHKHILRYKQIYESNGIHLKTNKKVQSKLISSPCFISKTNRFQRAMPSWHLSPNRYKLHGCKWLVYDLKDIILQQTGLKGPYACFTGKRDNSTLMGYMKQRSVTDSSATMIYNIKSEIDNLLHPRNYFVLKIRKGSRFGQKPYLRFILKDLSICPRDVNEPGPTKYTQNSHCIAIVPALKETVMQPYKFYNDTTVPTNARFETNAELPLPGPGRYNSTFEPTCFKAKTSWMFKSKVHRLVKQFKMAVFKTVKTVPMQHEARYLHMIREPKRAVISDPLISLSYNPIIIKFNTTERPPIRRKLRQSKKIAFMSGCPRFKDGPQQAGKLLHSKKQPQNKPDMPPVDKYRISQNTAPIILSKLNIPLISPLERLQKIPKRLLLLRNNLPANEKICSFQPLPPPKILIRNADLHQTSGSLTILNKHFETEEFLITGTPNYSNSSESLESFILSMDYFVDSDFI